MSFTFPSISFAHSIYLCRWLYAMRIQCVFEVFPMLEFTFKFKFRCGLWVFHGLEKIKTQTNCEYIQVNALLTNISTFLSAISFQSRQMIFDMWTSWVHEPKFKVKRMAVVYGTIDANNNTGYSRLFSLEIVHKRPTNSMLQNWRSRINTMRWLCWFVFVVLFDKFRNTIFFWMNKSMGFTLRRSISCPLIGAAQLLYETFFFSYC